MYRHSIKIIFLSAVALILISCDAGSFVEPGPPGGNGTAEITSLDIGAGPSMITEDDSVLFTAIVQDADGGMVDNVDVEWSSTDEKVAYVESTGGIEGTLLAKTPGTTTITASYEDLSASTTVEVHRRPVDLVYVGGSGQKGDPSTQLGDSLAVRIIDKRGDAVSDVQISFVVVSGGGSVSPGSGTTDADGRLSAAWTLGASGPQAVEARASVAQARVRHVQDSVVVFTAQFTNATGENQVASVTVSPPNDTVDAGSTSQLQATVRDADGNEITGRSVRWSSSDTTVATVSQEGVVAGVAKGEIAALAKVDGVSGAADIMVAGSADGTLVITSSVDTLFGIGSSATFAAEARAADGSVISGPDVQWNSSDSLIAAVDSMGAVTARALGVAVIAASAACCDGGAFVEVTVVEDTVSSTAPATVAATPSSYRFSQIGQTVQISATASDSSGNVLPDVQFAYTSTDPSVVSVDDMGTMTANALGTAAIVVAAVCCDAAGQNGAPADTIRATVDTTAQQTLFEDDFESYALGADASGGNASFDWGENRGTIVTDLMSHSGSRSVRFRFGPKPTDGRYWSELSFDHTYIGPNEDYWVEYYIYFPDGTEDDGEGGTLNRYEQAGTGSPSNNKYWTFWGGTRGSRTEYSSDGAGNLSTWQTNDVDSELMAIVKPLGWSTSNSLILVSGDSDRGRWIRSRIHIHMPDVGETEPGQRGYIEFWKDDQHIVLQDVFKDFTTTNEGYEPHLTNGYLLGYDNIEFSAPTLIFIDDFKFYTTDPGW